VTHCTQETVNLNECITFWVYDRNSKDREIATTTGTIKWYTSYTFDPSTRIDDPSSVTLTSLGDTSFYADVSGITVSYSNGCNSNFQTTPFTEFLTIPIKITSNYFLHDYNYDNMCFGDPVQAVFRLVDDSGNPSPCDTISDYEAFLDEQRVYADNIVKSPTTWTLVFAPFTGLEDTIKVKIKGDKPGLESEVFKLFLRKPITPFIIPSTVCKTTPVTFSVNVDRCDTIRNVTCTGLSSAIVTPTSDYVWDWYVPKLDETTPVQCAVTYTSKLHNKDITETINSTLEIWEDPPKLSVSLLQGDDSPPFDNTVQHLCRDDSLLFTFFAPYNCDTIIKIDGLQDSRLLSQSPHRHSYIIKPTKEGTITYNATVYYRRPKEEPNMNITKDISYTVSVKRRPRLFIKNPPDTLKYCSSTNEPLLDFNESQSPVKALIDYTFVSSDKEKFIIPHGGGVEESSSITPSVTGNYFIKAEYKYFCSEMSTASTYGEVRIVVNEKNEPLTYYIEPRPPAFCISDGVTIKSTNREGSSLKWFYNDEPADFPKILPAEPHTFTTKIYNACHLGDPMTYSVGVKVAPLPEVTAMPDITVCRGDIVPLETLPNPVGTLTWTDLWGQTVSNPVQIQDSATFVVHAEVEACGSVSDAVTVFRMADAAVRLMPDTSVCNGDYMRLRYEWKEGDIAWKHGNKDLPGDNPVVPITQNETYTATASNDCGTSTPAVLKVTMLSLPFVKVKADTSICHGESLDLESCIIMSTEHLQWTPGNSNAITEPDIYIVTASTEKCGSAKDTMYVNVYPPLILLPNDSHLPRYSNYNFYNVNFQVLQAEGPISYVMSGTLPPSITMADGLISGKPDLGPYDYKTHHLQVTVTDGHECRVSKEYLLLPEWKAANVLLPMSDDGNDVFLPDFYLEVYNRNGLLLHKGMGWDGKWNNAFVPAGTYFYKVKILIDGIAEERMNYVVVMYY
jgi:hypothetical protein